MKIVDRTSEKLLFLQKMLLKEGLPKGYITTYKNHSDLWIYINKEFNMWLVENVVPHMSITNKSNKLCPGKAGALPR